MIRTGAMNITSIQLQKLKQAEHHVNRYIRRFKSMKLPFESIRVRKEVEAQLAPTGKMRIEGKIYPYRLDHAKSMLEGPSPSKVSVRAIHDDDEREALTDFFASQNHDAQIRNNGERSRSKKLARTLVDKAASHEQVVEIFDKHQFYENWMAKVWHMYLVSKTGGWTPKIDITSDHLGANSQTLFYMDTQIDASLQKEAIKGLDVTSNPPYKKPEPFIEVLEQAFELDSSTRAYLWVPERSCRPWFQRLIDSEAWRLIAYFPPGEDLFSQPKCKKMYDGDDRGDAGGSPEPIVVFELNADRGRYRTFTLDEAKQVRGDIAGFLVGRRVITDQGIEERESSGVANRRIEADKLNPKDNKTIKGIRKKLEKQEKLLKTAI